MRLACACREVFSCPQMRASDRGGSPPLLLRGRRTVLVSRDRSFPVIYASYLIISNHRIQITAQVERFKAEKCDLIIVDTSGRHKQARGAERGNERGDLRLAPLCAASHPLAGPLERALQASAQPAPEGSRTRSLTNSPVRLFERPAGGCPVRGDAAGCDRGGPAADGVRHGRQHRTGADARTRG